MPKVRQLSAIDTQMGDTEIAIVVEIVTAALQRNYPDVTADEVENILDLANAGRVLSAVLTGSGLKAGTTPGEAEAPAAAWGLSRSRPMATDLRPARHRLRIQLSGDRCDDAPRC